jgi:membrane protein implicated in regulation of membrane protease activity
MEYLFITFWQWWILSAVLLVIAALMISGFFMIMSIGFAAFITGLVVFLIPIAVSGQVGLFLFLTILCIIIWRKNIKKKQIEKTKEENTAQKYIGLKVKLDEAIEDGIGSILVNGTRWYVKGHDLPQGSHVVIQEYRQGFYWVQPSKKGK